jgi:hypothetical protein
MIIEHNNISDELGFSDDAIKMSIVKALLKKDKTKNKVYIAKVCKYIYNTYKKDHDLAYLSIMERQQRVCDLYIDGYDVEKFRSDKLLQPIIDEFVRGQYSITELFYERLKNDFFELQQQISNIPWTIKQKVKKVIRIPYKDDIIDYSLNTTVEFDNSEEKLKSIARAKDLISLEEVISSKIAEEKRYKKQKYASLNQQGLL